MSRPKKSKSGAGPGWRPDASARPASSDTSDDAPRADQQPGLTVKRGRAEIQPPDDRKERLGWSFETRAAFVQTYQDALRELMMELERLGEEPSNDDDPRDLAEHVVAQLHKFFHHLDVAHPRVRDSIEKLLWALEGLDRGRIEDLVKPASPGALGDTKGARRINPYEQICRHLIVELIEHDRRTTGCTVKRAAAALAMELGKTAAWNKDKLINIHKNRNARPAWPAEDGGVKLESIPFDGDKRANAVQYLRDHLPLLQHAYRVTG